MSITKTEYNAARDLIKSAVRDAETGQLDKALKKCVLVSETLKKIPEGIADYADYIVPFYLSIADIYHTADDYQTMREYMNIASNYIMKVKNHLIRLEFIAVSARLSQSVYGNSPAVLDGMLTLLTEYEKASPPNYSAISSVCGNIGNYYMSLKTREGAKEAMKMYNKSLKSTRAYLPPNDPEIAKVYNSKGAALTFLEEYDSAFEMFKRALGKDVQNPNLKADLYHNMATALFNSGKNVKALEYYEYELEIYKNELKEQTLEKVKLYAALIYVCYKQGLKEKVLEFTDLLADLILSLYLKFMTIYEDNLRANEIRRLLYPTEIIFAMANYYPGISLEKVYNVLLHAKDIGKEAELAIKENILPEQYPEHADEINTLQDKQQKYQEMLTNKFVNKTEIESLQREITELKFLLAPYVRRINFKLIMESMMAKDVLAHLTEKQALIEYCCFYDATKGEHGIYCYFAFLLYDGKIEQFFLNPADDTNDKIEKLREKITEKISDVTDEATALYDILIAPFAENLKKNNIQHIYISPDSQLFNIPFEILCDRNRNMLSDNFTSINYIFSGRDIARPTDFNISPNDYITGTVFANPAFDLGNSEPLNSTDNNDFSQSRNLIGKKFRELQSAKLEAEAFVKSFKKKNKPEKLYEHEARKDKLTKYNSNKIASPNIIHIVTHGFYFKKQNNSLPKLTIEIGAALPHKLAEDPMIRCGLAFAGANNWRKPSKEYGDGILNAREILSLDLSKTDLLVLSACETALGETINGDGVKGLRRAFELAGVNTLICTLWSVDDGSSAILMSKFYENLFEGGMPKIAALSEAKNYIRGLPAKQIGDYFKENGLRNKAEHFYNIARREPDIKPYENSYYWAGYILHGRI